MCLMDTMQIDKQQSTDFAETFFGYVNGAAITLMVSVGHRTGLFDAMADLPPATSEEIATAANLNERYVREWLGTMVTGKIVTYNAEHATYRLPAEHAAWLTRAASPNNLATFTQFIPVLGSVEGRIVECFRNGGGVPYAEFPRFQTVMAEESSQTVASALLDAILPLASGVVDALHAGIEVLDVGCGSGHAINEMAAAFPNSRFAGYEISEEGVAAGRAEAQRRGLTNVRFELKDAATLDEPGRYGLITAFDAIHDQAHPDRVLAGVARSLGDGGTFLMQDIRGSSCVHNNIDNPLAPLFYTISCMHCMTVSLADGGLGLGAMWGREKAEEMLAEAGFTNVTVKTLDHDIQNYYYVAKR